MIDLTTSNVPCRPGSHIIEVHDMQASHNLRGSTIMQVAYCMQWQTFGRCTTLYSWDFRRLCVGYYSCKHWQAKCLVQSPLSIFDAPIKLEVIYKLRQFGLRTGKCSVSGLGSKFLCLHRPRPPRPGYSPPLQLWTFSRSKDRAYSLKQHRIKAGIIFQCDSTWYSQLYLYDEGHENCNKVSK